MLAATFLLILTAASSAALRARQDGDVSATDSITSDAASAAGSGISETSALSITLSYDPAQFTPTSTASPTATDLLLATTVEEAIRSSATLTRPRTRVSSVPAVVAPSPVPAQQSTSTHANVPSEAAPAAEPPTRSQPAAAPAPAADTPSKQPGGAAAPAAEAPSKSEAAPASDAAPGSDAKPSASEASGAGTLVVPGALVAAAIIAAAVF